MPVSEFSRRKKRKRDDDRPATVVAIAQARKGRSHNAALLVDYARRIKEIETYFLKYPNDFASSLKDDNTKLDLINVDANHLIAFFETKEMQYLDNTWGLDDPQNAAKYRSALWYHRQSHIIPETQDDGVLPPHFKDTTDPYFSLTNIKSIFPFAKNLTDEELIKFKPVMLRTLASVVHHYDEVEKKYPMHSICQSALGDENKRLKLKSLMVDNFMDFNCTSLNRTGVDKKERKKEARMIKIEAAIDGRYNNSGGGSADNEKLDKIMKNQERILALNSQRRGNNENENGYTWQDGTESPIPEDFTFPVCKILGAFRMWNKGYKHCGKSHNERVIPFKDLTPAMFKTLKSERKKFSKWKYVMNFITAKLDEKLPSWPSEDEWKIQPYLTSITDEKLEIDGVPIEMANYSVSYIYNLLKKNQ